MVRASRLNWLAVAMLGGSLAVVALPAPAHAGPAAVRPASPAALVAAGSATSQVERSLGGVSCTGPSFCMGVGPYGEQGVDAPTFSQIWNGKAWQAPVAVPAGPHLFDRLVSVSCASARNCVAVGSAFERPQVSDAWNGRTWRELPALTGAQLLAVACPAAGECIAVGDGATGVWAQLWNGTNWSQQAPVVPAGSAVSVLNAISCPGPDNCTAVGEYDVRSGQMVTQHALAESWNGTAWTMLPAPPSELAPELTAVSCPTATECVVAGEADSSVWNGSTWTTLTIQGRPTLTGVSCASATDCIAVGGLEGQGGQFALKWSGGSSWQLLSVPGPPAFAFAPGGASAVAYGLNAVSCTGPASCIAVGGAGDTGTLSSYASFAVSWNGSRWRVLRAGQVDGLLGVSCIGVSQCLVTGTYLTAADVTQTLAETWNGKTVRVVSKTGPRGVLSAVSCASLSFCMAAGEGSDIDRWNGHRWILSTPGQADFPVFSRVLCLSRTFCVATGAPTLAEFWNGRKWQVNQLVSHPGTDIRMSLGGLSCTGPAFCMVVGHWFDSDNGSDVGGVLAEVWNGKGWRLISAPNGYYDNFNAVSCVSSTDCMAIGHLQVKDAGPLIPVAARWNGRSWHRTRLPGQVRMPDISCPTASNCMAIGSVGPVDSAAGVALTWNGRTWRRIKVSGGGLDHLSCAATGQCLAVGNHGIRTFATAWNGRSWRAVKTINP